MRTSEYGVRRQKSLNKRGQREDVEAECYLVDAGQGRGLAGTVTPGAVETSVRPIVLTLTAPHLVHLKIFQE